MAETINKEVVYIGRRQGTKHMLDCFAPIIDGSVAPREAWALYKADRGSKIVGGVYLMPFDVDGSGAYTKRARYVRPYKDDAQRQRWKLESDAVEAIEASDRMEKKDWTAHLELLKPLRDQYKKCFSARERRAIEIIVLGYLRQER